MCQRHWHSTRNERSLAGMQEYRLTGSPYALDARQKVPCLRSRVAMDRRAARARWYDALHVPCNVRLAWENGQRSDQRFALALLRLPFGGRDVEEPRAAD